MGIQGLIPFLKKATSPVNIRNFSGCTVAVDAYCWLHKGAFSCADKLAKGEPTDGYIHYCIKMVNSLLNAGVQPVMVFDGQRLPSKALTESKRHENRVKYRKKAKEFLIQGNIQGARECFQRCTEVTSQMALDVVKACRKIGVDCIIAPYEADAQLAYLCKIGIAQIVVTEDSDLVLFGCDRIIFKMDINGNGLLVERSKLHLCLGMKAENFTFDKFRYMCIMSGCDYLPSLPGIGLGKAMKFFSKTTNPDLKVVLTKIPSYLNMSTISVSKEYIANFLRANHTFIYQLVYDPLQRKTVPLNPYAPEINPGELDYAGPRIEDALAYQIALGNVSVDNLHKVDNFNPDRDLKARKRKSIWDRTYTVQASKKNTSDLKVGGANCSKLLSSVTLSTPKQFTKATVAQKRTRSDSDLNTEALTDEGLVTIYGNDSADTKKLKIQDEAASGPVEENLSKPLPVTKIVHSRFFPSPPIPVQPAANVQEKDIILNPKNNLSSIAGNLDVEDTRTDTIYANDGASIDNCKNQFKRTQEISGKISVPAKQNGKSLFFDTAIASINPSVSAKPFKRASSSSPLPINSSPKIGNFGNWNNLRKYFSYSTLNAISKSPRNHTEFKQVVKEAKVGEMDSGIRHARINLSQDSEKSETCLTPPCSQNSSTTSEPSSQSPETHHNALTLDESMKEENEENILEENRLSEILNDAVMPTSKILKPTCRKNELASLPNHASQSKRPFQPISCRRLGLTKKKSRISCQDDMKKQQGIKELLAKFNYTNTCN